MEIQFHVDGPLDVKRTLARYWLWGEDPANRLCGDTFRRVLRLDGRLYGYELAWSGRPDAVQLTLSVPGSRSPRVLEAARHEVSHLLFLDADLSGFYRFAKGDRVLSGLVDPLYGLRPTLAPAPFEMLVGAITAQQVNLPFAFTIRSRLVRRFGEPVDVSGERVFAFPTPERLARATASRLKALQFSARKAEYLIGLARLVAQRELDFAELARLSNDQVIARLTRIRGLGSWTAEWFLARAFGRGDVCPAGDLGVRKCFAHFYSRGRPLSERAIRRRAREWGEYQNLAVHYLLAGRRLAEKGGR